MRYLRQTLLIASLVLAGFTAANAAISITVGKGDFYVSVGDYDYLPYGDYDRLPRVSFYEMMNDYGTWVDVSPFGHAWRPYVYRDWRPYTYGHWTYTRFGPTWEGYEPWAWAAYHYGNWIWSQYYGWVWLPGYDWHPGRVLWSSSYNTIGWMPAPPAGYNYLCGYLCRDRYTYNSGYGYNDPYHDSGSYYPYEEYNDYNDYSDYDDYSDYNDYNDYGYDNDRYDNRYNDPYSAYEFRYDPYVFTPAYLRIVPRLWVFVPTSYFTHENYADVYYDYDYTRYLFDRRFVQINPSSRLDRYALERIVKQRIVEEPVEEKTVQTDRQPIRVVVPTGEKERIRKHANRVVKEVIAPAFVEKQKPFKAERSRNNEVIARVFEQDPKRVQTETLNDQTVLQEAKKSEEKRKVQRQDSVKRGIETMEKADREGKLEDIKRARVKGEEAAKQKKVNQTAERPNESERKTEPQAEKSDRANRPDDSVQKRSEQDRPNANDPQKFENWKERERNKFNVWKDRQRKEFETWKEEHKDQPAEVKKAEADFQQRMRKAEEQFQQKTKRAEDENRSKRS